MNKTLILFAHGARDPEWARPVQAVAQRLQTENPDLPVVIAFLEFMSPTLPEAIDAIVRQLGDMTQQIDILPFFIAQGGHLRNDFPVLLESCQKQFPGVKLSATPAVGEDTAVLQAIVDFGARAL